MAALLDGGLKGRSADTSVWNLGRETSLRKSFMDFEINLGQSGMNLKLLCLGLVTDL